MIESASEYPRGVEVVASAVIVNEQRQVLLVRSVKWGDLWLMPGGHVDPGETMADAACREGEEEVGYKLRSKGLLSAGELINDPDFNRKAHLVYFHFICEVVGGELVIDPEEIREARWFDIDDALTVVAPGETTEHTLLRLRDNQITDFTSRVH